MRKSIISMYFGLLALSSLGIGFTLGIYSNFLRSYGLSELQLNSVNMVFFLTIFVFEIPTGVYADVFGRKKSFVISCFLMSAAEFTYSSAHSFPGFMAAEILAGIGATFATGAFQSWFVDRMRHHGYGEKLTSIFAWEGIVRSSACIVAVITGGKLADISFSYPWLIGGTTSLVSGVLGMILMKEEYFVKKSVSLRESFTDMKETAKQSWRYVKEDRAFRFILTIGFVLMFANMAPNMQWPKVFETHLHSNLRLSLFMAVIQVAIMSGGYMSRRFLSLFKGNERTAIIVCQALIGLPLIFTVLSSRLPSMAVFFLIHEIFRGLYRPIKEAYLQDMLPGKERATLISFESVYGHLGGALGLLVSGAIATVWGIPVTWSVAGGFIIITSLVLLKRHKG